MQEDDDILEEITQVPIRVIAFDCGGVLLSNAWADENYQKFSKQYNLDHDKVTEVFYRFWSSIELGKADETTFFEALKKEFSLQDSIDNIKEAYRSTIQINTSVLAIVRKLSHNYDLYTLNNEGKEWMDYRLEHFDLREYFKGFITSAYVGARKPDEKIYHMFLCIANAQPEECLFIDDKEENLIPASALGMKTILFESAAQLVSQLRKLGLKFEVKKE